MRRLLAITLLAAPFFAPLHAGASPADGLTEKPSVQSSKGEDTAAQLRTAQEYEKSSDEKKAIYQKDAAAQMLKGEEYEKNGDVKKAISAYNYLLKKWPKAQTAARAQLAVGVLNEKIGEYDRAFNAYGQYISKHPDGEEFERCVESQFRIARLFLEGQKHKMLGLVPMAASPQRAQQMFEEIVKNAAYSRFAPLAQFSLGRALEKQVKDLEAITAYQTVISKYPNDPVAADAQYQIGYILLQESRTSGDNATAVKARDAFDDFIAKYPNSEKIAQAKDDMNALSGRQTKGTFDVAKFYDKRKNYKAAVIYYNDVIKLHPGTPEADLAKKRIDELQALAGDDALRTGPERAETGKRASERRKLQAKVETAARPDFAGPPVVVPDEIAPDKSPKLRTSPGDIGPVPAVEPPLPTKQ